MEKAADAAREGDLPFFQQLPAAELARLVTKQDEDGRTLLHGAASCGNLQLLQLLLDAGARAEGAADEEVSSRGLCPLQRTQAARAAALAPAHPLCPPAAAGLDAAALGSVVRPRGRCQAAAVAGGERQRGHARGAHAAALCCACASDAVARSGWHNTHTTLTAALLCRTPPPCARHPCVQASKGRPSLVRLLLQAGAQADARDAHGATPLHRAAGTGRLDTLRVLLEEEGAKLDARDEQGATPLLLAAAGGHQAAAAYLAAKGADVEAEDKEGETPLGAAVPHGKLRDTLAAIARGELQLDDLMLE